MTESEDTKMPLRVNPQRAKDLTENLSSILAKVRAARPQGHEKIRTVAVSKLKPANDILALHQSSHAQLHFGENYEQELTSKAQMLPLEIRWHFIGALQTNKCRPLAEKVPNLWCVESVDTQKKADQLQKGRQLLCESADPAPSDPLRVFVQVNTSGEAEKSGVEPQDATALCRHIRESCSKLRLQGLMTIGAIARSQAAGEGQENEDFIKLREVRDAVAGELGLEKDALELSMGMSEDFESAIRCGSDEVRIGSTLFGQRPPKKEASLTDDS